MMRLKNTSLLIFCFCFCCLCSCTSESDVFLGEWQDAREPGNVWSISKSGSSFSGKRVSGSDFYKYDSEEWNFELGEGGYPSLVPAKEGGSTLVFQPNQNRVLRNPPGRVYIKVIKESK